MCFIRRMVAVVVMAMTCICQESFVGANQTPDTSPIYPGDSLPFDVTIEQAFLLPNGIHSGASAMYKGKWLFIAGRTNGLHGFEDPGNNNFPPSSQNTLIYVVDPKTGTTWTKSLTDPTSGLTQQQIDTLSVTSPQSYQTHDRLYISGGYGVNTATGLFDTKDTLTAIDLKGIIEWVTAPITGQRAIHYIRQVSDPIFKVTGGYMARVNKNLSLIVFGQDFLGYYTPGTNGEYTEQVRRFKVHDDGKRLSVTVKKSFPETPDPNYRRRDLNVVPVMHRLNGLPLPAYIAYSGVFTLDDGIWTVPVLISYYGKPSMDDPADPDTFKQGMNNYASANFGLFQENEGNMYVIFFGGISYGFFQGGSFQTDSEFPFINQVTTVKLDKEGNYTQYLMANQYPTIASTGSNPGNTLLFGAGATFMPVDNLPFYKNGVLNYDSMKKTRPRTIGYIVGGIQSTLPNTNVASDSAASPYVFKVILRPR